MRSGKEANRRSVFLNVPFDKGYEPLFVALISALVSIGRVPHCVLELPDGGDGRLARLFRLIRSCPVSMHDLCRVGLPVRFNMPFELGLAVALNRMGEDHHFFMLESKRYRLQTTLSDTNGIDPGIHEATTQGIISCALAHLGKPRGNPDVKTIIRIQRQLWKTVAALKTMDGRTSIFSRPIFSVLVDGATSLAEKEGLLSA